MNQFPLGETLLLSVHALGREGSKVVSEKVKELDPGLRQPVRQVGVNGQPVLLVSIKRTEKIRSHLVVET